MNLESPWMPRLEPGSGTVSERIAAAIALDIAKGILKSGDRLPPHREASYVLGVSVGTVTRGYVEAARRGLLAGSHGKATFVTDIGESRAVPFVDLSLNVPPAAVTDRQLSAALSAISRRTGTSAELGKYTIQTKEGQSTGRYSQVGYPRLANFTYLRTAFPYAMVLSKRCPWCCGCCGHRVAALLPKPQPFRER